jgi:DNA-binding transcriptional ArsR family regulator
VNAFDIVGDPVRRRLIELLSGGEMSAGDLSERVREEFGISQPAVSNQLRVLRENGFAAAEPRGARRIYALDPAAFAELDEWVTRYGRFWTQRLDALDTEIARARKGQG